MDLQGIGTVAERLAAEFGIRPPKVKAGWVPRSMRLGVRAKIWGRRLGLVIGPAAGRLEPDEIEGEVASAMALFTLRRGFWARLLPSIAVAFACEMVVFGLLANSPLWVQDVAVYAGTAIWLALVIIFYRGLVYRADRKVVEVIGAAPLLAVLEAERRNPSGGFVYLFWALPNADRRAERLGASIASHSDGVLHG